MFFLANATCPENHLFKCRVVSDFDSSHAFYSQHEKVSEPPTPSNAFEMVPALQRAHTKPLTSAASPTFAGIVSLLNSARLSEGRKPLGFLNPFIYKYGYRGLTDIVNGKSKGCTGKDIYSGLPTPFVPDAGWSAVKGWDPVTGYGTPNFPVLLALSQAQR